MLPRSCKPDRTEPVTPARAIRSHRWKELNQTSLIKNQVWDTTASSQRMGSALPQSSKPRLGLVVSKENSGELPQPQDYVTSERLFLGVEARGISQTINQRSHPDD